MPSEPNYSAAAGYSPKAEAQYGGDTLRGSPGFGSSSPMDRIQIARSGEMEREIGQLALQLERAHTLLSKLRERLYPILVDTPPDAVTGGVEKEQSPQTPLTGQIRVLRNQARDCADLASSIHERLAL